ncbi:hypothetical protein Bbelb_262940 [Branchiostoma belcheri]|nr:hypothetical protein Bbelb_262940 [Branchiostoma belcheri]
MSKLFVFVVTFVVWTASSTVTSVVGCGDTLTAPPGGVVTSPNYPSNYPPNQNCEWLIIAPALSRIRLTFQSFQTYSSDSLSVYDGESSGAKMLERISGRPISVSPITSTFNLLFLKFRTDRYNNRQGFKLSYTILDQDLSYTSHELTAPPGGFLTSPNYPNNYDNHELSYWLITAPALSRIRLTFERGFQTEYNLSPVTSTFNAIYLRFTSNDDRTYRGFKISYTSVEVNYTPQSQEYLTTLGGWNFYKIPTSGPMTNANVRAACESAGMWNPCSDTGYGTCRHGRSDCIAFDGGSASCRTLNVISDLLCGNIEPETCKPLDDTFVYSPGWQSDDSALGVDYDTGHWGTEGANYNDKYALCAGHHEYLTTWDGWMFFKIRALGRMTNAKIQTTCERLGMSYPCWYTGHGPCHSGSNWRDNCIKFDHAGGDCQTTKSLSNRLCGTTVDYNCLALNHTFVYYNGSSDSRGIRYGSSGNVNGTSYSDMYALCAAKQCETSPCVHGTCVHLLGGYTCVCDEEGSGDYCDSVIDSCASNPCMSGGTCIDEVGGYTCVCHPHTTGRNCDTGKFLLLPLSDRYRHVDHSVTRGEVTSQEFRRI